jgi:hypothetical protein
MPSATREVVGALAFVDAVTGALIASRTLAATGVFAALARALDEPMGTDERMTRLAHAARVGLIASLGSFALLDSQGAPPRGVIWPNFLRRRPPAYPREAVEAPVEHDEELRRYLQEVANLANEAYLGDKSTLRDAFELEVPDVSVDDITEDDWVRLVPELAARAEAFFGDDRTISTERDTWREDRFQQARHWATLMATARRDFEIVRHPLREILEASVERTPLATFGAMVVLAGLDLERAHPEESEQRSGGIFGFFSRR